MHDNYYHSVDGSISANNVSYCYSESEFVFGIENRTTYAELGRALLTVTAVVVGGVSLSLTAMSLYYLGQVGVLASGFSFAGSMVYAGMSWAVTIIADMQGELTLGDLVNVGLSTITAVVSAIQFGKVSGVFSKIHKQLLKIVDKCGSIIARINKRIVSLTGGTVLEYTPSSGASLISTPGKTTTIIGNYERDMESIIKELDLQPSLDFDGNPGGFNVLNTPSELYVTGEQYWKEYNQVWLQKAIDRGDEFILATKPIGKFLENDGVLTGFGREFNYLKNHGYIYNESLMRMIKLP